jgi:hypothetical protein
MAIIRIQLRRGTAAEWAAYNPILASGEPGYEEDTGLQKVGNGILPWSSLDYTATGPEGQQGPPGVADDASVKAILDNPASQTVGKLTATIDDRVEAVGDERYTKAFVPMTKETNHPRARKPLAAPIFTHAMSPAPSIYWPWLVDRAAAGGVGVDIHYSTDHAVDNTQSGLYRAYSATGPLGAFASIGRYFRDSVDGTQTETPSVVWDGLARIAIGAGRAVSAVGTFTSNGHSLQVGDEVELSALTGASGLVAGRYFVQSATTNTFTLSATRGGALVTAVTSGTATVTQIGQYLIYYQQKGVPGSVGAQQTMLATGNAALSNVARSKVMLDMVSINDPGDGHMGYFKPFAIGGRNYAYHLNGGEDYGRYGLSRSEDGQTWITDPQQIGAQVPYLKQFGAGVTGVPGVAAQTTPARSNNVGWKSFVGCPVEWKGRVWWIGLVGPRASGTTVTTNKIVAVPLREDLMGIAEPPIDITPAAQAWEGASGITGFGNIIEYDGKFYGVYQAGGPQGGFGLLEIF